MQSRAEEVRIEAAIPPELAARFRRIAADNDRSMRQHLRALIREAVARSEAPDAPNVEGFKTPAGQGRRHAVEA